MGPLTSYDTPLHHSPVTWAILNPLSPHYWVTREDPLRRGTFMQQMRFCSGQPTPSQIVRYR